MAIKILQVLEDHLGTARPCDFARRSQELVLQLRDEITRTLLDKRG